MIIKLNVGGRIFLTDEETLSEGMLGALIQHQNPAQQIDGCHFIDRDPDTFRWILNYLRGSKVLPSKDSTDIQLIREEAEYFALDQLVSRIQHMSCPSFSKGDNVTVRGSKFTILSTLESGYKVTRLGKCFQVNASENVEKTTVEVGDVVMAYHKPSSKRLAGICMAIRGKNCVIQFNGVLGQEDVKDSGVRF
tara:strand:+ start:388 stop:966 length:579 start_codon:yes stop_codon:yes gene_type:complete